MLINYKSNLTTSPATTQNTLADLKEMPYWCGYTLVPDVNPTKKPRKVPYSLVTGSTARVNDLSTLANYNLVAAALLAGKCDGINYVFGYCDHVGIDLDTVRDINTGVITCPKAVEIVDKFTKEGAYIEISPSGTGLRIICKSVSSSVKFGKGHTFPTFELYGKGQSESTGKPCYHSLSITQNILSGGQDLPFCLSLMWLYETYFKRHEQAYIRPEFGLVDSPDLTNDEIIAKLGKSKASAVFNELYYTGTTSDASMADLRLCSMIAFYTQNVEQINEIFCMSKLFRDKWKRLDYRQSTINQALKGLKATWQPPQHTERYGVSESEAARRFTDNAGGMWATLLRARQPQAWRYVPSLGIWEQDHHQYKLKAELVEMAKLVLSDIVDSDPPRRLKLLGLAGKLESNRGLNDIGQLALQQLPEFIEANSNTFDGLLPVQNGVVDLCSGRLLPHSETYQFTLSSPVLYDKNATCPMWLKFINELCCGDEGLRQFIHVWSGYSASGYTTEHKLVVLNGLGANGKSVYLDTMQHILGGFAASTPAQTLLQHKSEQTNDIADLQYIRFVSAVESEENSVLAEGLVKSITGGDKVTCRKLYENNQTFKPKFKLNLATNHKPRINSGGLGVWRRLLLVPCNAVVTKEDKNLVSKLISESAGILNWMIAGFQIWERDGLVIPAAITAVTDQYKEESDTVGRFITDVCNPYQDSINHGSGIQASILYKKYVEWAIAEGHKPYANTRFSQKMAEHSFPSIRKKDGMFYASTLNFRR